MKGLTIPSVAIITDLCLIFFFQLGEKPDAADYFKSSSCPKITSFISNREHMTIGSPTVTMDTTSPSDNQRRNVDTVSSENLDPSHNKTLQNISMLISSRPGSLDMSGSSFTMPSSAVSVSEKRMRQKVGRNLLGAAQSASPLTPRYDCEWNNLESCFMLQAMTILVVMATRMTFDYRICSSIIT